MAAERPASVSAGRRTMDVLRRTPQCLLLGLVQCYRLFFKAWLGSACRFEPSCSAYALQALQQHGAARGAWLTTTRLLRCHPYCAGGCDPVPKAPRAAAGLFSGLGLHSPAAPPAADAPPSRRHSFFHRPPFRKSP